MNMHEYMPSNTFVGDELILSTSKLIIFLPFVFQVSSGSDSKSNRKKEMQTNPIEQLPIEVISVHLL